MNHGTTPSSGQVIYPFSQAADLLRSPPTPVSTGHLVLFSAGKVAGTCSWPHSPLSSVEVKNKWSYTSSFTYVFMAWYLIKLMDNTVFIVSGLINVLISSNRPRRSATEDSAVCCEQQQTKQYKRMVLNVNEGATMHQQLCFHRLIELRDCLYESQFFVSRHEPFALC